MASRSGTMTTQQEINEINQERDEALLSLDQTRILAYADKYGAHLPFRDGVGFWASVHKARTGIVELPLEVRQASKAWLDEHKMHSFDDGELG